MVREDEALLGAGGRHVQVLQLFLKHLTTGYEPHDAWRETAGNEQHDAWRETTGYESENERGVVEDQALLGAGGRHVQVLQLLLEHLTQTGYEHLAAGYEHLVCGGGQVTSLSNERQQVTSLSSERQQL
jgi:hypothetical protein